ncbi:MAG: hypothetical protein SF029_09380 [bacterium]|nr:hypothetical protein [bacterium]
MSIYRKIVALLSAFLLCMPLAAATVQAQSGIPTLAAVTNGSLYLYGNGEPLLVEGPNIAYYDLTWSADNNRLAYTVYDGTTTRLMLTDANASSPVLIAEGVSYLPVTFTSDGSQIIYTVEDASAITELPNGLPGSTMTVFVRGVDDGSEAQSVGSFGFGVGCGGGSPFPMDAVYNAEAGFGGSALTFENTPYGILHSTACTGIGLALFDLSSGTTTELGSDLSRAQVNRDGRQVLVVRRDSSSVALLDLEARQVTDLTSDPLLDQIGWGADGTPYYSTRTLLAEALPLAPEEAAAFSAYTGMEAVTFPQYQVSLYQLPGATAGAGTQVYTGPGWAVGQIFGAANGLYFSLVPNGEAWVEAITAGQIDLSAPDGWRQEQRSVAARLMRLNGDGTAAEVASEIGQAEVRPGG